MPLSVALFSYSINEDSDSDSSMSSLFTPPRYAQGNICVYSASFN